MNNVQEYGASCDGHGNIVTVSTQVPGGCKVSRNTSAVSGPVLQKHRAAAERKHSLMEAYNRKVFVNFGLSSYTRTWVIECYPHTLTGVSSLLPPFFHRTQCVVRKLSVVQT